MEVIVLLLFTGILVVPASTSGASEYTLSTADMVDGPTRTVTLGGTEYTITKLGQTRPGTELAVTAAAPSGTEYDLYLYDADRRIVDTVNMQGSGTATFRTQRLPTGSYLVAVYADGRFPTVLPVVVPAYEPSVTTPESVATGTTLSVTVTLANVTDAPSPSQIDVSLVRNETVVWRADARKQSPGRYTLTRRVDAAPGAYAVFVSIRGERTIKGQQQLLGLSDRVHLSVTNRSDSSPTDASTPATPSAPGSPDATDADSLLTPRPPGSITTDARAPTHLPAVLGLAMLLTIGLLRRRIRG